MNDKKTPTLADVAKLLGVATATCSMALRNDPRISEATRKRVKEAADSIGYQPDPLLAALVSRRRQAKRVYANLATVMDDRWLKQKKQDWAELLNEGMQRACGQLGYHLENLYSVRDLGGGKDADRIFRARGIQGLILLPTPDGTLDFEIDWDRYAVVTIGNTTTKRPLHRIATDAFAAMSLVCTMLKEMGYHRVGLAHAMPLERRLRFEWLGAMSKEQYLPGGLEMVTPHLPMELTRQGFLDWVAKEKPECVVTGNEDIPSWLESGGFKVPDKIGVAFLGKDTIAKSKAAGILQHMDILGECAVKQLHAMLACSEKSFPTVPREILIYPQWGDGYTLQPQRKPQGK